MYFLLKCLFLSVIWFNFNLGDEYLSTTKERFTQTELPETECTTNTTHGPERPKAAMMYQNKLNEMYLKQRDFSIKMRLQDSEVRRHYIVIYGLREEEGENTENKVFTFLCSKFPDVKISQQYEIDEAIRLGKKSFRMNNELRDDVSPRPILIKLTTQLLAIELAQKAETVLKYTRYGILKFKDVDDVFDRKAIYKFLQDHNINRPKIVGQKVQLDDKRFYTLYELKKKVLTEKYGEAYYKEILKGASRYGNRNYNNRYYTTNDGKYDRITERNRNFYRSENYQRYFPNEPYRYQPSGELGPMTNPQDREPVNNKNENEFQQILTKTAAVFRKFNLPDDRTSEKTDEDDEGGTKTRTKDDFEEEICEQEN